jgi:hypothetical protein
MMLLSEYPFVAVHTSVDINFLKVAEEPTHIPPRSVRI